MMKSDVGLVSAQHLRSLLLRDCVYLKFSLELKTSFFDNSVFCGLNVEFLRDIVCSRGQSVECDGNILESSQVVSGVGRGDLVVCWLMFYVTLIQPINNTPRNSYQGRTALRFI